MRLQPLTSSSLRKFRNCRRSYFWRVERELVPIERDSKLHIGSVFHGALERWFKLDLEGLPKDQDAIEAILAYIDQSFPERFTDPKVKRNWMLTRAMFLGYVRHYSQEPFHVVAVEREFSVPIRNPRTGGRSRTFQLRGKVDLVVQMHDTGELFIVEHKTTSSITGSYIERLPLDTQVQLYVKAMAEELGEPIAGVIYDVVAKAQIRQREKRGETDAEFMARLEEKYRDPGMFLRENLYVSPLDIQAMESEVWEITQQILHARRTGAWYRNTDLCFRYGSKPCPYFELCRSGGSENVIANLYRHKPAHSELEGEEHTDKPEF